MEWNLPASWSVANSFDANRREQEFRSTIKSFKEVVYVGGDFRIQSVPVFGRPVFVTVRGSWMFTDADFSSLIARIMRVERKF